MHPILMFFSLDWGSMPVEFRGMKLLGASTSGTSHEERPEPTSRALRVLQVFPRAWIGRRTLSCLAGEDCTESSTAFAREGSSG